MRQLVEPLVEPPGRRPRASCASWSDQLRGQRLPVKGPRPTGQENPGASSRIAKRFNRLLKGQREIRPGKQKGRPKAASWASWSALPAEGERCAQGDAEGDRDQPVDQAVHDQATRSRISPALLSNSTRSAVQGIERAYAVAPVTTSHKVSIGRPSSSI